MLVSQVQCLGHYRRALFILVCGLYQVFLDRLKLSSYPRWIRFKLSTNVSPLSLSFIYYYVLSLSFIYDERQSIRLIVPLVTILKFLSILIRIFPNTLTNQFAIEEISFLSNFVEEQNFSNEKKSPLIFHTILCCNPWVLTLENG